VATLTAGRVLLLAAAGAGAFALAARLGRTDADIQVVAPAPRPAQRTQVALAPAPARAALPERAPLDVQVKADPFAASGWTPPAPPPPPAPKAAPPPPPPPPTAPPLPFTFVGLLERGAARPAAFLAKGEALHVVGVGDVIDGAWRVESLAPHQIVVTYLPLGQRQTLTASGGQP
jgi:hypothetical protein